MGSKEKYTKYIVPIINKYILNNNITEFYDVFCGGANLISKIKCEKLIANDLSPTLISLHKAMQDGIQFPDDGSREWWDEAYTEYKRLMKLGKIDLDYWAENSKMPLWKIGAIEWYPSFARGGFPRGYAKSSSTRNYYKEGLKNHKTQSLSPEYKKIKFIQSDYLNLDIPENALIYCDAPYKNTKPYAINPKFDFEQYYNWLKEKSKTNPIFISEQSMPNEFSEIWTMEVKRTAGRDHNFSATEKLYFIDNRKI